MPPQQDISPTALTANNTPPRLIESSTDNSTANYCNNKSYDNIEYDRPNDNNNNDDDDCFPWDKQHVLPQQDI